MEAILKRDIILDKSLSLALGVFIFVILTFLGAFVRIYLPFTPVPLTLQTLFVLLAGAFLGASYGALSQFIYIMIGLCGIPVFTGAGSGLLYLLGPTGGYIIGFILSAFLLGKLLKVAGENRFYIFTIFCLADFLILSFGSLWLKFVLNIDISRAFALGFVPFLFGDMLKNYAAYLIYSRFKARIGL